MYLALPKGVEVDDLSRPGVVLGRYKYVVDFLTPRLMLKYGYSGGKLKTLLQASPTPSEQELEGVFHHKMQEVELTLDPDGIKKSFLYAVQESVARQRNETYLFCNYHCGDFSREVISAGMSAPPSLCSTVYAKTELWPNTISALGWLRASHLTDAAAPLRNVVANGNLRDLILAGAKP
jgi:hypothetical protein